MVSLLASPPVFERLKSKLLPLPHPAQRGFWCSYRISKPPSLRTVSQEAPTRLHYFPIGAASAVGSHSCFYLVFWINPLLRLGSIDRNVIDTPISRLFLLGLAIFIPATENFGRSIYKIPLEELPIS